MCATCEVHHDASVASAVKAFKKAMNIPPWRPIEALDREGNLVTGRHLVRTAMNFIPSWVQHRRVRPRFD